MQNWWVIRWNKRLRKRGWRVSFTYCLKLWSIVWNFVVSVYFLRSCLSRGVSKCLWLTGRSFDGKPILALLIVPFSLLLRVFDFLSSLLYCLLNFNLELSFLFVRKRDFKKRFQWSFFFIEEQLQLLQWLAKWHFSEKERELI